MCFQGWDETMYETGAEYPTNETLLSMGGNMFNAFSMSVLLVAVFAVADGVVQPPEGSADPKEVVEIDDEDADASDSDSAD